MEAKVSGRTFEVNPCPECGQAEVRIDKDGRAYAVCPCCDGVASFPNEHVRERTRLKGTAVGWVASEKTAFRWPTGVSIEFEDGSVWDARGAYDSAGESIDCNPEGTGGCGSPCHQVLVAAGYNLEEW